MSHSRSLFYPHLYLSMKIESESEAEAVFCVDLGWTLNKIPDMHNTQSGSNRTGQNRTIQHCTEYCRLYTTSHRYSAFIVQYTDQFLALLSSVALSVQRVVRGTYIASTVPSTVYCPYSTVQHSTSCTRLQSRIVLCCAEVISSGVERSPVKRSQARWCTDWNELDKTRQDETMHRNNVSLTHTPSFPLFLLRSLSL
jgi:hypothetical protein